METIIIKNGLIIDPANHIERTGDVLIVDGVISQIGTIDDFPTDPRVIDATDKIVCPGFIDMHCHLREPGREDKETIKTGTMAAAAGGFTSICPMGNTSPVCDCAAVIKYIKSHAETDACVNIFPMATVTMNMGGEDIVEFGDLYHEGIRGFTDDGNPVMNAEIMRCALSYASMFDLPILDHCEDTRLSAEGVMHAGEVSVRLGLKGIPAEAESIQVARDIDLAKHTGGHIHIQHVSKAASLEHIRRGKKRGIHVTAEVTPHHLCLTDHELLDFNTNAKINPPLGSEDDRQALIDALADGTIDCISTDHAPHTEIEKDFPITFAPFGTIGFETAFAACYTYLVKTNRITLSKLIEKMTAAPADIIKIKPRGTLTPGTPADITIIDLNESQTIDKSFFRSKSSNSCFLGKTLWGIIKTTLVNGKPVFQR